jgi:gamma-glutamylcyclotransferase (GGCT)/AIG2-like uncharacterized protein YtfP
MLNVFTYGTLMFSPVWERVVAGQYDSVAATVTGFARFAVANEAYPGCVRRTQESVLGRLYLNLTPADCARLDAFEGQHYARTFCVADIAGSAQQVPAWIYEYLLPQGLAGLPWNPEQFEREAMATFISTYSPTRLP